MADSAVALHHAPSGDVTKRDFLQPIAITGAAVRTGVIAWPRVDSMNPCKDVLALSAVDADMAPIIEGRGVVMSWQGKPIFARHRSAAEIKEARDVKLSDLIEPQTDAARVKAGYDPWMVLSGICTHLGCIPSGNKPSDPRGEWGGWFSPCHGSQYDTSGRVRHGPAPLNFWVPPYAFQSDTKIKVG